jgi:4-amino-4-deoxy-L-arabinose transferase-like glycosyltransferase
MKPVRWYHFAIVAGRLSGKPVTVLCFLSLILGLVWMLRARPMPFSGFYDYYNLAQGIVDQHQFGYPLPTARRLPGYPALLALAMLISRSFLWLGFVNVLLTAALVPVVFRLTLALTGHKPTALVAAAACSLNPTFIFFSPVFASEHLFALLFFLSLLMPFLRRPKTIVRAVLAGVFLGLSLLTRGEAVFYSPIVFYTVWVTSNTPRRSRFAATALALAVCVAVIVPWTVRNRAVIGPGVGLSTAAGVNFYYAHNPTQYGHHNIAKTPLAAAGEVERQKLGYDLGRDYLSVAPYRVFWGVLTGTPHLLWKPGTYALHAGLMIRNDKEQKPEVIHLTPRASPAGAVRVVWFYRLLLVCAVGSLFLYRQIGRRAIMILYGIVVMNWVCYSVIFWSKPRFRYTTEVVFCVLAGIVVWRLWEAIRMKVTSAHLKPPGG